MASTTIGLLRPDKDDVLIITTERGKEFAYHDSGQRTEVRLLFCSSVLLLEPKIEGEQQ